ncbi:hypothetical protein ACH5A3_44750, partial [Streptomyces echinatus]|uniref:hypothetical protein n=1 Tax=Streptomyces echinatus TaxID=67293 RepID=UPI00378AC494
MTIELDEQSASRWRRSGSLEQKTVAQEDPFVIHRRGAGKSADQGYAEARKSRTASAKPAGSLAYRKWS